MGGKFYESHKRNIWTIEAKQRFQIPKQVNTETFKPVWANDETKAIIDGFWIFTLK